MQQISKKTLVVLLLMAIGVSIAGTIISINRINNLIMKAPLAGMASSSGTGMVNVTIAGQTSITAEDSLIQFGSCSPDTGVGCNATSNISNSNFNCSCSGGSAPDNLTIKNDGNRNINVTVQTNSLAKNFIGGGTPKEADMWFSTRNSSDAPGCYNITGTNTPSEFDGTRGMQWDWKNFSVVDTEYPACMNLTPTSSFYLFAKLFIPANAPAGGNRSTTLTFTAANW